ncbi:hypothetical protein SUGI_1134310 [Cryptomeria japonica]|nr:hypothetical protein SUGI_1134310 [Cryptomeria japonica]
MITVDRTRRKSHPRVLKPQSPCTKMPCLLPISSQTLLIEEEKEAEKGNDVNVKRIKEYCHKVEDEFCRICNDILTIIDEHLIPSSGNGESTVFYYKMKGGYYRYLAKFKSGNERKEVADQPLKA